MPRKKSHLPFRLNMLMVTTFFLFLLLIMRLSYLQVIRGEEFESNIRSTKKIKTEYSVPRGMIYDRNGQVLVGNKSVNAITYTKSIKTTNKVMIDTAEKLANLLKIDTTELQERDLKDYIIFKDESHINKLLTNKEKMLKGSELYNVQLSKVNKEKVNELSEFQRNCAAILKIMNGANNGSTVYLKNSNVTDVELAQISEHLDILDGVDTGNDWERIYPQGDILKSILGDITSEKEGLPLEELSGYLAKGYHRNSRVGKSYLEKQYETVLSGNERVVESTIDNNGNIIETHEKYSGKNGDNLVLTIDLNYQKKVEEILSKYLQSKVEGLSNSIFVTVSNPNNGELLAISGKEKNLKTGRVEDDILGVINSQYTMGSIVKGATVLAGYMDSVITSTNNQVIDEPLKFKGTEYKSSLFNQSGKYLLNDELALEVSSNVYMMTIAMRMGGQYSYIQNGVLSIDSQKVITKLRNYYGQFGLGVKTGIDLPNEAIGFKGSAINPGLALDFSYGQYDTYTPLQLNQYISTIANDGARLAPRLVNSINKSDGNGGIGDVIMKPKKKVLNNLNVGNGYIQRVKKGLHDVVHGSSPYGSGKSLKEKPYDISAKTGTAEAFYDGQIEKSKMEPVTNLTTVAYAPSSQPEIAVSIVIPNLPENTKSKINLELTKEIFSAYFEN